MNNRPTPETDALISKDGFNPTAWEWQRHSRRIERERNELREVIREAWLAMEDTDGTDRMINWQNKYAYILEESK